jgi:hypothetical protein
MFILSPLSLRWHEPRSFVRKASKATKQEMEIKRSDRSECSVVGRYFPFPQIEIVKRPRAHFKSRKKEGSHKKGG